MRISMPCQAVDKYMGNALQTSKDVFTTETQKSPRCLLLIEHNLPVPLFFTYCPLPCALYLLSFALCTMLHALCSFTTDDWRRAPTRMRNKIEKKKIHLTPQLNRSPKFNEAGRAAEQKETKNSIDFKMMVLAVITNKWFFSDISVSLAKRA